MGVDIPFGDRPGLSGVDLVVEASERFVLVGASGAGKSVLLRAIAGSGPFSSGSIRVGGHHVSGQSLRDLGLVLLEQRPLLFPHLTVRGNVAFPLEVRGISRDEVERRVVDVLDAVRLPELAGRMPHTLSGGQAHRVALARAVVVRPRVLLLDEPLTSLDPSLREEMREAVVDVGERYGSALLLVTHDLREAGRIGERVGVLTSGRLAQVAEPEVLFRNPESLEVARFIGWRNELPARIEQDGSLRVGAFVRPGPWTGAAGRPPAPGPVTVSFGTRGARLRAAGNGEGPTVRITAVRHEPHGTTAEYRLDPSFESDPERASAGGGPRAASDPLSQRGEVAVDGGGAPQVGKTVSLEILPTRARVFPVPDSSNASG